MFISWFSLSYFKNIASMVVYWPGLLTGMFFKLHITIWCGGPWSHWDIVCVSPIRLTAAETIICDLKGSDTAFPAFLLRGLGVWCSVVHAAPISFIPFSLAALCPPLQFHHLNLWWPPQSTTHSGKVDTQTQVYTHTAISFYLSLSFAPFKPMQEHANILTRGIFSIAEAENPGWYRHITPLHTPHLAASIFNGLG